MARQLVLKAGFVSRTVGAYFVAIGIGAVLLLRRFASGGRRDDQEPADWRILERMLLTSVLAVTIVHMLAPFPYDDYQVAFYPLFAVVVGAAAARLPGDVRGLSWLLLSVFFLTTAASFSSPVNQEWAIRGRDRIWWRVKDQSPLKKLQEAGRVVRSLAGTDRKLLTQDTYLAVEAGLSVPAGLELGPFSYFPEWTEARASACHVVNRAMLDRILRTSDATVAAFSGYGLAIKSPAIEELPFEEHDRLWRIVTERYSPFREMEYFGQAHTRLTILAMKHAEEAQRER